MMWIKCLLYVLFGLSAGFITACGYFALFSFVGVLTRFIQFSRTSKHIYFYEGVIITGVTIGNIICIYEPFVYIPSVLWIIFAAGSGIFTGCFIVSLTEAVKGVPVFTRRTRLKKGLAFLVLTLAVGKGVGSMFYFFRMVA